MTVGGLHAVSFLAVDDILDQFYGRVVLALVLLFVSLRNNNLLEFLRGLYHKVLLLFPAVYHNCVRIIERVPDQQGVGGGERNLV